MKKVLVLTSGGMDSTTLLHHHVKGGDQVRAIAFNYGQRHQKELDFARYQAAFLGTPFHLVPLVTLADTLPGSSQTDLSVPVPEGRYDEESMKKTVVPNRNMILLSIAIGHAIAHGLDYVAYAAHAGDHAIYSDCRPEFAEAMNVVAALCDWHKVELLRPFIKMTKADIVTLGVDLKVDYLRTWSCYRGEGLHCGRCGTCVERREAFHLADIIDPTPYHPLAPTVEEMVQHDWHLPAH